MTSYRIDDITIRYNIINNIKTRYYIILIQLYCICKNIRDFITFLIWWFVTLSILMSVGVYKVFQYGGLGSEVVRYIYELHLYLCSKILDATNYVQPNHKYKSIIMDRGSKTPYLERYYLLLKNRETFPFNIFLHKFIQGDNDDIHDHPWEFFHIILSGGYWEQVPKNMDRSTLDQGLVKIWRRPGYYNYCDINYKHRIILGKDKPWTLFIPFKRIAEWGFWVPIIWNSNIPCSLGTIIDGDNCNKTQWTKIGHETYLNNKYNTDNSSS